MYARDVAIRAGETVVINVSNKPFTDMTVPPELNDYYWADNAHIEIFDTENNKIVSDCMTEIPNKPGWYCYVFRTQTNYAQGIYRVVVRIATYKNGPPPSGSPSPSGTCSPSTTGSSGCPLPCDALIDVKVSYLRIMDLY
jgi:hypothetical protein